MSEQAAPCISVSVSKAIGISLFCLTPLTGFFSFAISIMLTDAPSTAERMENFLKVYWTVAAILYVVSLVVSIVLWSRRRNPVVPLVLSGISFVAAGTPVLLIPLAAFVY
ncbi:MAG: hypothetical protein LIO68_07890 [Rikenellaceae bacterium]|nr:hypothetical protein [Rikenellaceae bacterium]